MLKIFAYLNQQRKLIFLAILLDYASVRYIVPLLISYKDIIKQSQLIE